MSLAVGIGIGVCFASDTIGGIVDALAHVVDSSGNTVVDSSGNTVVT